MEVNKKHEKNQKISKSYLIIFIFLIVLLIVLFIFDMRDQVTYFHDKTYDNYTSISNLNIANWTTFFGAIIAVFGTWFVTNENAKMQMQEARENLLLEKISNLKIYYFVKNIIEDHSIDNKNNPILIIPANSNEINYIEWNREINILNGYLRFKNSSLHIERPIHFISFNSKVISKILNKGETIMLLDLKGLESIDFDVFDFFFETMEYLDEDKFLRINYGAKLMLTKISAYYFELPLDFTSMNYKQFSESFNIYFMFIFKNQNIFQKNISSLIDIIETGEDRENKIQTYYQAVYESLEKRNKLYEIIYNTDDKNFYMDNITNYDIKLQDIHIVSSSQEYSSIESDMQLLIKQDEYYNIISELEDLKKYS